MKICPPLFPPGGQRVVQSTAVTESEDSRVQSLEIQYMNRKCMIFSRRSHVRGTFQHSIGLVCHPKTYFHLLRKFIYHTILTEKCFHLPIGKLVQKTARLLRQAKAVLVLWASR